jgi:hypothetical protein
VLHQIEGLRAQVQDGGKVDAAWVFEDPDKPLLPFEVGGDRRCAGDATREGRCIEEELSPVHRHSHRFQGRHQAVELGPTRDGTGGELLLGRIDQDEQRVVGAWPVGAGFPLIDHPDHALTVGQRMADGCGLCL